MRLKVDHTYKWNYHMVLPSLRLSWLSFSTTYAQKLVRTLHHFAQDSRESLIRRRSLIFTPILIDLSRVNLFKEVISISFSVCPDPAQSSTMANSPMKALPRSTMSQDSSVCVRDKVMLIPMNANSISHSQHLWLKWIRKMLSLVVS